MKNKYKIIILSLVICIVASSCNYNKKNNEISEINTIGNTTNNIINGGYMAKQGDWVYYYYSGGIFNIGRGLYKSTIDNKNTKKITSGEISNINVIGNWIYYVKCIEKKGPQGNIIKESNLYKIKNDGTQNDIILKNCNFINIINNSIYYSVSVDSIGYEKNNIKNYSLKNEVGYIYKANIDGSNKVKLVSKNTEFYLITKQYIYYALDKGVYRINIDGTNEIKILLSEVSRLIEDGNNIYYISNEISSKGEIYKINYDGDKILKIMDKQQQSIEIGTVKNYMFFISSNFDVYQINKDGSCKINISKQVPNGASNLYTFNSDVFAYSSKEKKIIKLSTK